MGKKRKKRKEKKRKGKKEGNKKRKEKIERLINIMRGSPFRGRFKADAVGAQFTKSCKLTLKFFSPLLRGHIPLRHPLGTPSFCKFFYHPPIQAQKGLKERNFRGAKLMGKGKGDILQLCSRVPILMTHLVPWV